MHFLTHEMLLFFTSIWTTNIHDNIHAKVAPHAAHAAHAGPPARARARPPAQLRAFGRPAPSALAARVLSGA
jgi:hypothetical protein